MDMEGTVPLGTAKRAAGEEMITRTLLEKKPSATKAGSGNRQL